MSTVLAAVVATAVLATLAGWLLTRRSGTIGEVRRAATRGDAGGGMEVPGLSRTGPTVVHFSAPWCGPCDQVRRVVGHVCDGLGGVAHVEIDLDADPDATRRFAVLSLPTTLIFDAHGRQRYRSSGVPAAADLRSALEPLLA